MNNRFFTPMLFADFSCSKKQNTGGEKIEKGAFNVVGFGGYRVGGGLF
jgi:hypothetical protein